ncbi:circularly permuted type 2 ATP-grasp protein [Verrucomicrobium sp. BvORR106]|uniref:circularly permuted type 2 ATP-grasp protein n=1 Tax=Verrucomicrobium sp. BvORR106 TaxID=1403819 RepID=UPI0006891FFD|nr:circularly permuted type 2 ATP-grasp protein [Verrucomicrobium sp. BvORR106]
MDSSPDSVSIAEMLASARAAGDGFHEVWQPDGAMRPAWSGFLESVSRLQTADLAQKRESANQLLRDHGATYTIYNDQQALSRLWQLDIFPHIIGAEEWRLLEAGLKQRSRLLRQVVNDLYGEQRLLKQGWVPPGLVFANPGFLRASHGIKPAGGSFLFHHAVDLARGADGRWIVLADRTQAPSGKGYALENRIVLTSLFPDEFRDMNVQRLASFFQMERDSLRDLAPQHRGDPTVVLLTPGPLNETYFEHAYKARYLGFPLVEGADLTVRGRKVFLKTLEGLRQVDVIVRRVDDTFCDPLELRTDTWLGVPGLMEAWRAGTVAIVNGMGAGVVETPALLPFLPGLSRHLLGEDLKLANAVTWWCGQPKELAHVEKHLDRFVLKRAFVGGAGQPVFGADLTEAEREALLAKVRMAPHEYAAQEVLSLSSAPVFDKGKIESRPLVLRCYIVPCGNDFAVMPGGLTRVSPSPKGLVVSMQSGGVSKDTWVLADGPVEQLTLLLSPTVAIRPERQAGEVPSRVADHFFWLGRYVERLEDGVRVLRAVVQRFAGEGSEEQARELAALVPWMVSLGRLPDRFGKKVVPGELRGELLALLENSRREDSVRDLLNRVRYNATALRDRLSDDTWRLFNQLERHTRSQATRLKVPEVLEMLNAVVLDLAAFSGMEMENMTRGHGWRFLDLGRRLERARGLVRLIHATIHPSPRNDAVLSPLLEICDSAMTYRRRYHARPQLGPVLDLLIADDSNPRSLIWQLYQLTRHASQLPRDGMEGMTGSEKKQVDMMLSELAGVDLNALAGAEDRSPGLLVRLCTRLQAGLESLSDTISQHYFSHALRRVS